MMDFSGMMKQGMGGQGGMGGMMGGGKKAPDTDPESDAMIQRILASVGGGAQQAQPALMPKNSLNPYLEGAQQDPAGISGRGRLEPGSDAKIQQMVIEELARQNPDFKVGPAPLDNPRGLPTQYPQQVKQPLGR